ncbi:hypothetical protein ABZ260_24050 [Streptosporangium sp. NPDC006013]|uniref:hypothetical protein n=1 Tax=Streptosporangium sp. NPDC006013 TaxID=3155596 RepID=UPI0033B10CF5
MLIKDSVLRASGARTPDPALFDDDWTIFFSAGLKSLTSTDEPPSSDRNVPEGFFSPLPPSSGGESPVTVVAVAAESTSDGNPAAEPVNCSGVSGEP